MHILNPYRHAASALPEPNTFIGGVGGVGGYIETAADFAALVSLDESDIVNFQTDINNNISFYVGVDYVFTTSAFNNKDLFAWFIDADGHALDSYYFNGCDNLEWAYFPSALDFGNQFGWDNVSQLKFCNFSGVININNRFQLSDAEYLKKLDLRSLVSISSSGTQGSLNELRRIERLYIGNLNSISAKQLENVKIHNWGRYYMFMLTCSLASDPHVYHHSDWSVTDRNAFFRGSGTFNIGDSITIDGKTYTAVATPTTEGEFSGDVSNLKDKINSDTRTGTVDEPLTALNDGAFLYVECDTVGAVGDAITVSIGGSNTGSFNIAGGESTFKNGNDVHIVLQELRDGGGATLVEVSTPITVNAPTSLSVSSITSSGFTINFTAPTANANGTDGYEVWVEEKDTFNPINYFEYDEITSSGSAISGLESGKTYIVKLRTIDGQMNFSDFSSTIEVTTS